MFHRQRFPIARNGLANACLSAKAKALQHLHPPMGSAVNVQSFSIVLSDGAPQVSNTGFVQVHHSLTPVRLFTQNYLNPVPTPQMPSSRVLRQFGAARFAVVKMLSASPSNANTFTKTAITATSRPSPSDGATSCARVTPSSTATFQKHLRSILLSGFTV